MFKKDYGSQSRKCVQTIYILYWANTNLFIEIMYY